MFTDLSKAHDSHIYVPLLLIILVQHEAKLRNKKLWKLFGEDIPKQMVEEGAWLESKFCAF